MRRLYPIAIVLVALPLGACAYWNTFYLAQKNYDKAMSGEPYLVDKTTQNVSTQNLTAAIDYSKKVIAQYPDSKWVDHAYLLWARALLAKDDPLQTVNMLSDFATRFPNSKLKSDAVFYQAVGNRQAHRPAEALTGLDDFLAQAPKHELVPYALLERARVLTTLGRTSEAADAAGLVIQRFPHSPQVKQARMARSEALLASGQFEKARDDFRELGLSAVDDEERFGFLLREADALEGAREYDQEIDLLRSALGHEPAPIVTTQTTATGAAIVTPTATGPRADHWGRLRLRIGTAHLLAGRLDPALTEYNDVLVSYPRSVIGAEAQYRIGYAWETLGNDFDKARTAYSKVKEQATAGTFSLQAKDRADNLDRLAQYKKSVGRDSVQKKAEAGFLLAELYLFQHEKPDHALEQYRQIEKDFAGTPWAGKAINAQAWVLEHRFSKKAEADSLYWKVIHEYRATDAQLAARDYLEAEGYTVDDSLIERPHATIDTTRAAADTLSLTAPPAQTPRLGPHAPYAPSLADSAALTAPGQPMHATRAPATAPAMSIAPGMPADSLRHAPSDSVRFMTTAPAPRDSVPHTAPAPRDTLPHAAPPDTTHHQ
jgi:tetratricopeptide (TPR) repeat protein